MFSSTLAQEIDDVSYDRDIRPLLADRCFSCHGPDAEARQAGLRLDQQSSAHELAVVPGDLDASELWVRINAVDEDVVMPPPSTHKPPLTKRQRKLIQSWIEQGANYEAFWAFEKPTRPSLPNVENREWSRFPIDRLVLNSLEQRGIVPSPEADSRTLVRRVTLDLTGLPPSVDEIKIFLDQEQAMGCDAAWESLVDRLLDSPHYGEHIARFWLDLVRFADTNGMHKDFYRNHFAYRDWVIRSYNDDLPFDQFLTHQLAGDLLEDPTKDQLAATAFHRLHLIIDRGTALPEESFHKNVVDRVTAFGTAFLGMTVHCAQCHDHKYDPISQKEFYSLYAFFNNLDAAPETVARPKNGLQAPFVSLADEYQSKQLAQFNTEIAGWDAKLADVKKRIEQLKQKQQAITEPNEDGTEDQQVTEASKAIQAKQLAELKKQQTEFEAKKRQVVQARDSFNLNIPYAMVMKERAEIRPTHVLLRGQYDAPGDLVQRQTPGFLPPLKSEQEIPSRLDLANWVVSPDNPLTSRVAVNRIWQQLFGVGLVKTSEDFGAQGELPSHPELLNFLAASFVESGWKTKALIKQIVMSKTYRQSSRASDDSYDRDPENRWLARGSRHRLDAEVIRDQVLFNSGLLVPTMYGPSVKPPQPDGLWKAVTMIGERYRADQGDSIYRRSIYTYWKRGMPPPQMTILNAPIRDACVARRERTNTPSQALLLLNEPEYMKAARKLAIKIVQQPVDQRIRFAWESVTCKVPDSIEYGIVETLLDELQQSYEESPKLAELICEGAALEGTQAKSELAAWTVVVNTLFNLDITKNRD
ncbi:MAG: DUF1553 domain-containing protein [Planctomycetota bacterium]